MEYAAFIWLPDGNQIAAKLIQTPAKKLNQKKEKKCNKERKKERKRKLKRRRNGEEEDEEQFQFEIGKSMAAR